MYQPPPTNVLPVIRDMFPRTDEQVINHVIQLVEENSPYDSFEQKIENIINMLCTEGAQGPMPEISTPQNNLLTSLVSIYGHIDEEYLHTYVNDKPDNFNIEDAIEELSLCDLPKKPSHSSIDPTTIWEQLRSALPSADPSYLKKQASKFATLPTRELNVFLQNAIENNDYPSMQEYIKNKKHNDEVAMYTENFDINKFLEIIPNAVDKFSDPNRPLILNENSTKNDQLYAMHFLYNQFRYIRGKYIDILFKREKKNLVAVCDKLEKLNKSLIKPRGILHGEVSENIGLLQVTTYLKYRKLIKKELKSKDEKYQSAKEEARKYGLLETCQCCFDDELIPEECYFCMKGCVFCKGCIQKGVEVGIGKGHLKFPCMATCNSEFNLQILQMILPKRMFERLAQKIASEEIKKANVDGLEICPFCDFAMVLPEHEKIFKCINEECLIESCRQCRHKSHIPLKCNEIEYDEDVRRRTFIENKMTEALTRTCHQCKKSFIKSSGCNKMACVCGALQCYLCGQPIRGYSHFNDNYSIIDQRFVLTGSYEPFWNRMEYCIVRKVELGMVARDYGIIMLSLPSHTSQRLQPLDKSFFKSLKHHFNEASTTWIRTYPGSVNKQTEISKLLGIAYPRAVCMVTALDGFESCGLCYSDRHKIGENNQHKAEVVNDTPNQENTLKTVNSQPSTSGHILQTSTSGHILQTSLSENTAIWPSTSNQLACQPGTPITPKNIFP